MSVFEFTHAIVREPGRSVVDGLRADMSAVTTYDGVVAEHRAYVAALRELGLAVDVLPPLETFPDSVFVEDPALVFGEGAILLRPGAASRLAEAGEMRATLHKHFDPVLELEGEQYTDGGDVLVTPDEVLIGLSKRTTRTGAEALVAALAQLGRKARIAQTPPGILHFKTASCLVAEDTVLATRVLAASGAFDKYKILATPEGEEAAANSLRLNDTVLVGDRYPRTIEMLVRAGFKVRSLKVNEIAKLDAGLSCMSLRWNSAR